VTGSEAAVRSNAIKPQAARAVGSRTVKGAVSLPELQMLRSGKHTEFLRHPRAISATTTSIHPALAALSLSPRRWMSRRCLKSAAMLLSEHKHRAAGAG
jgi:hypothetical protein